MGIRAGKPERVAEGVWRIAGGLPIRMINVFLIEEPGGGVSVFDAGIKGMGPDIRAAADARGGAKRLVLGNAHADHRGGANAIGAPVCCHERERPDVEGDGGAHYFDYGKLGFPPARLITRASMGSWDGGPVEVSDTVAEGHEIAGFRVIELPGHGPGCIGLWRESDRLAITNDCFALFDPELPHPGAPRIPHPAFNFSTDQVRESIEKLASLEPATCWPGHFGPVSGDVPFQLRAALAG